jgi:hypothetical protein
MFSKVEEETETEEETEEEEEEELPPRHLLECAACVA